MRLSRRQGRERGDGRGAHTNAYLKGGAAPSLLLDRRCEWAVRYIAGQRQKATASPLSTVEFTSEVLFFFSSSPTVFQNDDTHGVRGGDDDVRVLDASDLIAVE